MMTGNNSNNVLTPRLNRINSGMSSTSSMNASSSFSYHTNSSPRSSIASASTGKYISGLTATSTFSSMDDHSLSSTTNSSAIGFFTDSIADTEEFGIIDTLDYEDVDDGVIDLDYTHRSRETLIESLLASEQTYTDSLELVTQFFLDPLRKDAKKYTFNFLGMKKMVCTERELRWLFGNFEEIVNTHRLILQSLKERLRIWGPTQILSDIFQAWFPNLECYRAYLNNYALALTTYERLTRYQPFKKFIDASHKNKSLKGATLLSLIQLPAGCINRYLDIMTRIADSTHNMHPDYCGLQATKAYIQQFQRSIRDKLADANNVDQVLKIHQTLIGAPFSVRAERRLVKQGNLSRVVLNTRTMGEERNYMLFSDLLLFVRPKMEGKVTKLQYKGHITLERARVRTLSKEEASGIAHCIELISSFEGVDNLNSTFIAAPTVHVLYVGSDEERDDWVVKLSRVIENLDKIALAKHVHASRRMVQRRTPRGSTGGNSATTSTLSSNEESNKSISSRESSH